MSNSTAKSRRTAVVTGGGAGIGAAIAVELARHDVHVVIADPMVTIDGARPVEQQERSTLERIEDAGGTGQAVAVSVSDRPAIMTLFDDLVAEHGQLDVVVNVAGISRPTSFTSGEERDWRNILSVHLDGYVNVLEAALPHMARAGHGHLLGVTSGSGWRPADAGAYGTAKRAVAALTWELGRHTPRGVVLNAISPIAMTRMVAAALEQQSNRTPRATSSRTGGLSLGSMPAPEQLGPTAAHLVSSTFAACGGQVLFTAGTELAIVEPPKPLDLIAWGRPAALPDLLDHVMPTIVAAAESRQRSAGGSNARLDRTSLPSRAEADRSTRCIIVSDRLELGADIAAASERRGVRCHRVDVPAGRSTTFEDAAEVLEDAIERHGPADGIVLAFAAQRNTTGEAPTEWESILAQHSGIVDEILSDAAWTRAASDMSRRTGRPMRIISLTDATDAGGRSRGQANAQLARSAHTATDGAVSMFPVSIETGDRAVSDRIGELCAHLLTTTDTPLSGAELVADSDIVGVRSHPWVGTSVIFEASGVPDWFDTWLEAIT